MCASIQSEHMILVHASKQHNITCMGWNPALTTPEAHVQTLLQSEHSLYTSITSIQLKSAGMPSLSAHVDSMLQFATDNQPISLHVWTASDSSDVPKLQQCRVLIVFEHDKDCHRRRLACLDTM